jgi:phosphoglycerate dehydrogenase-like enzyme
MGSSHDRTLLILHPYAKSLAAILSQQLHGLRILAAERIEDALPMIGEGAVEVLISPTRLVTDELLGRAVNLRWVASTSAGNDRLAKNPRLSESILLTKGTSHGTTMAEYVLAYMLYFSRQIENNLVKQREKIWNRSLPEVRPLSLQGKTLGVLGLGSTGRTVAKYGKALGMTVLGLKRTPEPVDSVDRIFSPDMLEQMIPIVDTLVVVLPLTQETFHFLGEKELHLMKDGALLINIGRGKEIDEEGLIRVLKTKKIHAVLDVCETEPLPKESELWAMKNVIITPHVSGIVTPEELCAEFVANYQRWITGKPLEGVVDRQKGY